MSDSYTHVTKNGRRISLKDMGDNHLTNTISLLESKVKEGVVIRRGGGTTAEDMWYDEDVLYGAAAASHLNLDKYVKEAKRRWPKYRSKVYE